MIFCETLRNLNHDLRNPVFTGGIARNYYLTGDRNSLLLNSDVDVVIECPEDISETISETFHISHYHPHRGYGKLILQLADKRDFTRVDVFLGGHRKTEKVILGGGDRDIRLLSLSETFCHILLNLKPMLGGQIVDRKYFNYFMHYLDRFSPSELEEYWNDFSHLFPVQSQRRVIEEIVSLSGERDLLSDNPPYEGDIFKICPHCAINGKYPLADKKLLFNHWGFV